MSHILSLTPALSGITIPADMEPHFSHRSRLMVTVLLLSLVGCSNAGHDREALKAFATAYASFHHALDDSQITMWVAVLDLSGERSTTQYRHDFLNAFDVHNTDYRRLESARLVVGARDDSNSVLDDFDQRNDKCDTTSLALVEAANSIDYGPYRKQAASLAAIARRISATLASMRDSFGQMYGLQVDLAKDLVAENGNMRMIVPQMRQMGLEQKKLREETDTLRDQVQSSVSKMETECAAIKGLTGISIDCQPPINSSSTK